jgi:predicted transcriptional regulator
MDVHLTPQQEMRLNELATTTGRGTDELVQEAVDRMLAYDNWFKEQVQVGLDQINRGEFVEDEEVRGRIERMFQS